MNKMTNNEALSSSEIPNSSDTIYRQAAIGAVRKCSVKEVTPAFMLADKAEVMTELMMLPSAQPERPGGEWILKKELVPLPWDCLPSPNDDADE